MTDNETVERLAREVYDLLNLWGLADLDWSEEIAQALLPTVRELQAGALERAADEFAPEVAKPGYKAVRSVGKTRDWLRAEAATYRSPQATTEAGE